MRNFRLLLTRFTALWVALFFTKSAFAIDIQCPPGTQLKSDTRILNTNDDAPLGTSVQEMTRTSYCLKPATKDYPAQKTGFQHTLHLFVVKDNEGELLQENIIGSELLKLGIAGEVLYVIQLRYPENTVQAIRLSEDPNSEKWILDESENLSLVRPAVANIISYRHPVSGAAFLSKEAVDRFIDLNDDETSENKRRLATVDFLTAFRLDTEASNCKFGPAGITIKNKVILKPQQSMVNLIIGLFKDGTCTIKSAKERTLPTALNFKASKVKEVLSELDRHRASITPKLALENKEAQLDDDVTTLEARLKQKKSELNQIRERLANQNYRDGDLNNSTPIPTRCSQTFSGRQFCVARKDCTLSKSGKIFCPEPGQIILADYLSNPELAEIKEVSRSGEMKIHYLNSNIHYGQDETLSINSRGVDFPVSSAKLTLVSGQELELSRGGVITTNDHSGKPRQYLIAEIYNSKRLYAVDLQSGETRQLTADAKTILSVTCQSASDCFVKNSLKALKLGPKLPLTDSKRTAGHAAQSDNLIKILNLNTEIALPMPTPVIPGVQTDTVTVH